MSDIVICRECRDSGRKSRVNVCGGSSTSMGYRPYHDEDGRLHLHNPNVHSTGYECINGHHWVEKRYSACWCGWTAGPDAPA